MSRHALISCRAPLAATLLLGLSVQPGAAQSPGDALNADDGTGAIKVCSPVAMPRWRSMTPVPKTWTFLDCMGFAGEMGAMVQIEKSAMAKAQPPIPNCGW